MGEGCTLVRSGDTAAREFKVHGSAATRKRHAHLLAEQNEPGASVRNEAPESVRDGTSEQRKISP